ncbi:MAG: sensor histidine kinase [Pikeienuella sp.]
MNNRLAITRIALICVVIGMVGLSSLGYVLQRNDIRTLQELSKENITWSAAQLEIELHRFMESLGKLNEESLNTSPDDVVDRFDILWSRAALFQTGDVGERLSRYDSEGEVVRGLFLAMQQHEEDVLSITADDRQKTLTLISVFEVHAAALRKLSVRVVGGEEERAAAVRDSLRSGQFMAAALSAGAVLMAGLLIAVAYVEARKYRRLADHNAQLAVDAEAANRAKSRFLTMMSHELRTPMNGVLGQLALAKLPGLPTPQMRLIEQAERSGRQMIGMLSDILDFAALQDEKLEINRRAFAPRELAEGLKDQFGAIARREGMDLNVDCAKRLPSQVIGDAPRLRQVLIHLINYVVDTAGTQDARILLDYVDGRLTATLSFVYSTDGGEGWQPEMMLGEPVHREGQFASDALGPMVARGLIDRMGGRIELTELYEGQTAVTVFAPADEVNEVRPVVKLEAASITMRMICEAALAGADVEIAPEGSDGIDVDVALIEAGADDEKARLDELRRMHPSARVIALGVPKRPDIFDGVAPTPIEVNSLRSAISRNAV